MSSLDQLKASLNNMSKAAAKLIKSFSEMSKICLPPITAGIALAYKNSQQLRDELERFKKITASINPVSQALKSLGDAMAFFVKKINDATENISILNNCGLDNLKNALAEIDKNTETLNGKLKASFCILKELGEDNSDILIQIKKIKNKV